MTANVDMRDKMDIDDLSDDQILQMLQEARKRLQSSNSSSSMILADDAHKSLSDPALRLTTGKMGVLATYMTTDKKKGTHVAPKHLVSAETRSLANTPRTVIDSVVLKKQAEIEKKATAGADWYNLPKTNLTPELKRDLQLLKMRGVLDPKRFYKKDNKKSDVPEYSQVGTIIQGPTEYYSARLTNKERKRTLVEEVLDGEKQTQKFKSKYADIQAAKTSGRKAHYKAVKAKRRSSKG